ncbi:Avirulence (Avh) protein [Phytophthora megakarya]|uniref:Avirulence (Avh) protein n=1 Tax=Phytophthora megakarya TaxID=4795 RepID=A0A225VVJ9_9STRA|nr:Avirulence (Avh) protein [Phytophthora megakarya]
MRLGYFLLLVLVTLIACCYSLATAEGTMKTSETTSKRDLVTATIVKHYINDLEVTAEEERALPGITKVTEFFDKIAKGEATKPIKLAVDKIKPLVKKETRHPAVSVLRSLLKMLLIVGAVSVASGFIIYQVSNK